MLLTRRFFIIVALIALASAAGFWYAPLYAAARLMLYALLAMLLADFVLLWTLGRVQAERRCSDKFCLGEDNPVHLHISSLTPLPLHLTVRDELPAAFRYHRAVFRLALPARSQRSVRYELHPTERGAYAFGHVLGFLTSPLGLIERKRRLGAQTAIKVYPAFRHLERYELAALTGNPEQGCKRIRRPGAQTEYEQIKEYARGDDYRTINWKATARARRLMVNTYRDERAQPIISVIDKGRAMQRTYDSMTLLDHAVGAALALSHAALRHDDMAGLLTFATDADTYLPPARRTTQLPLILEQLYAIRTDFAESDFGALAAFAGRNLRRRSLLVLFTDFDGLDALARQLPNLRLLARRCCLLTVFFEDKEISQTATATPRKMEDYILQTLAASFAQEKRNIATHLSRAGIYSLLTTPARLRTDVISKYLELKQRGAI